MLNGEHRDSEGELLTWLETKDSPENAQNGRGRGRGMVPAHTYFPKETVESDKSWGEFSKRGHLCIKNQMDVCLPAHPNSFYGCPMRITFS